MLKRFWLLFAQAITIILALFFVVATLKPAWLHLFDKRAPTSTSLTFSRPASLAPIWGSVCNSKSSCKGLSYAYAAERAAPSVVKIFSSKNAKQQQTLRLIKKGDLPFQPFFEKRLAKKQPQSAHLGSGVIVSEKGYILTDDHVIHGADDIEVTLADGRQAPAKLVGTDAETDLSVLKIDLAHLPAITFGDLKTTRIGDVVLAIGNPYGVGQTVTMGIISALGRSDLGISTFENLIQTDAPINPGNSGGALIDVEGNLLGINTAIYSRSGGSLGIGFAIPASTANDVLKSIVETGTVTRGWIGVELQNIYSEQTDPDPEKPSGAMVSGVLERGPAALAGILNGDIIIGITSDKKPALRKTITDYHQLLEFTAQMKPGTKAILHLIRKTQSLDLTLTVGRRPVPDCTLEAEEAEEEEEEIRGSVSPQKI